MNKSIAFALVAVITLHLSIAGADSLYKLAGGQIYSIYDASAWVYFDGLEVTSMIPHEGLICQPYTIRTTTSTTLENHGGNEHAYVSETAHKVYSGQQVVLLHYASAYALSPGSELVGVKAILVDSTLLTHGPSSMRSSTGAIGTVDTAYYQDLTTHLVYDCGVDYYPPVKPLTAAQALAAGKHKHALAVHTFHWLQKQATNGSLSAQSSLGVHYLHGDGTETNLIAGMYWLNLAATNGSLEASNTLAELSHTNAPVVDDLAQ